MFFRLYEDRPRYYATFSNALRKIQSARAALYLVGMDEHSRSVATLAILDVSDASEFIKSIRDLFPDPNLDNTGGGLAPSHHFEFLEAKLDGMQSYSVMGRQEALSWTDRNQLRIVPFEGKIILFLGSELGILRQAILDVKNNRPGLERNGDVVDTVAQHDPDRKMQLCISIASILSYMETGALLVKAQQYSSTSLTITAERIKLDITLPLPELRAAFGYLQRPSGF